MSIALKYPKSLWSYNPIPRGCVLYLPLWSPGLNGSAFKSVDPYGHSNTVTGSVLGAQGRVFDGDDLISLGDPTAITSTTTGTVAYWAKPTTLADIDTYLGYGGADVNQAGLCAFEFRDSGGTYYLTITHRIEGIVDFNIVRGDTAITVDNWYFCVISSSGTGWTLHVNDVLQGESATLGSDTGDWFGDTSLTTPVLYVGVLRFDGSNVQFAQGVIGEVFIYDRELSADEKSHIYSRTRGRYQ